ncbi:MAG: peptide deformylase [Flavobacteriaceae bacterium]|nr:peptide deformylase [Flavobacteriaceae bacterium]|tara:strand:+ start:2475 stop:3065 length:591 start_codon:yes stop_codon:yes gene_type:complete
MILPILAYGTSVLKQRANEIDKNYIDLNSIIRNMWDTMYNANGVGLAAPQIGLSIRVFIIDTSSYEYEENLDTNEIEKLKDFKQVFINPKILEQSEKEWIFNEGCLSIPDIRGDINRSQSIKIKYFDEKFNEKTESFSGLIARVILHEYDHIEGILFTDKLSPLRRKILQGRLQNIYKGKIDTNYPMSFFKQVNRK